MQVRSNKTKITSQTKLVENKDKEIVKLQEKCKDIEHEKDLVMKELDDTKENIETEKTHVETARKEVKFI